MKDALFVGFFHTFTRIGYGEVQAAVVVIRMQSNTTAGGKLYRVGQKVVGYLPYAQRVAFKITVECRVCLTNQLQLFSTGKWCEAHFNFVKQVSGIKRDVIHLGLVEVQTVEVEQICHQL
ncbi:hypothetical protein SDC9_113930 [bioreactor metagenome]|uniref:Uncharacterized protein n=1 Tax=bioreactor metagenome TaxID=1076179 RepID=A0A645BP28_9ZZZZ